MYMRPFTTSRITTVRLPPPRLPGGMSGSTRYHAESVRSLGYRNLPRSYRPRFFAVHMGDPLRIRPPPLNHKCFIRFNISPDGHIEMTAGSAFDSLFPEEAKICAIHDRRGPRFLPEFVGLGMLAQASIPE